MVYSAIFIDLPNFYSRLLKSGIEIPRFLKGYFLDWLDFDLLASSLTKTYSGIWVFYSGRRIGPSGERIDGSILNDYIRRINILLGVTARDVNIPGVQREPIYYRCEKCDHEGISEALSEKGVDSSLVVHMFDTMDSWDTAFLLSGDADFVPAVSSLRRRGKIVIGVGFLNASPALLRECYNYINIDEVFLRQDILAYSLFKKDGIVQKWLSDEPISDPAFGESPTVEFGINCIQERNGRRNEKLLSYQINFWFRGVCDLSSRKKIMADLQMKHKDKFKITEDTNHKIHGYDIYGISEFGYYAILRKYKDNFSTILDLVDIEESESSLHLSIEHQLVEDTGKYVPVQIKNSDS